jgi:transposase
MAASKISKILRFGFGIQNVILDFFDIVGNFFIIECRPDSSLKKCPRCHSRHVQIKETKIRRLRMVPLGKLNGVLKMTVHKFKCKDCGASAWIKLPFACGKLPMTIAFVNYTLSMMKLGTIQAISTFLGLNWKTVKNIHKEYLKVKYKKIRYRDLRYLSMDEFSIKKGHKYMTIFLDLMTGRIVYAVEDRSVEAIRPFLEKLAKRARKLEAIAMDLSASFISAVKTYLPHVAIVFDHFHVTKILNQALDEVRREEFAKHNSSNEEKIGKGDRFLFFRNYEDMEATEQGKLKKLLEINETLTTAYQMKEQFRGFWGKTSLQEGAKFLVRWIYDAFQSGIAPLKRVANTILSHYEGLLNYFTHPISNGKIEGTNNKIKVQKRSGYGYTDMEYFKLLLLDLHNKTVQLAG